MKSNDKNNNLSNLGEFGLIEQIRRQVKSDSTVPVGIGDDCAATIIPEDHVLLTSKDLLIEDVHFRRSWTSMYQLGRKSAAVNLSDVAAMGGRANHLFLGVALPIDIDAADLEDFTRGFLDECSAAGATLCGGDTCRSNGPLIISVTVQGSIAANQMVKRSGAQIDDDIYVSGFVGDSALALAQLQGDITPCDYLILRHNQPTPRLELGQQLVQRQLANAMIDLSDGLFADLGHIMEQSHCGALVDCRCLPFSSELRQHLDRNPADIETALRGGEDYELLFCADPNRADEVARLSQQLNLPLTHIGNIKAQDYSLQRIDINGNQQQVEAQGFNHFK